MNKKFKVGLIRVLTTEDEEVLQSHGKQIMEYFPELEVVTKCIPDQYEGIHSPELGEIALPKIVETARSFTDVDMIIVSCADDPGVAEIRKVLPDIPVTGGGETTVALALKYGSRIGVLGMKLKEQGAEVIALACTGLATIGIAKDLEKETGLPVIDPVMAEGMFAYFEYLRKK